MGFRDSVHALLDTYTKCLDLLQSVGATSGNSGRTATDGGSRSALSLSLLDDRAKVQQAYTSRLREAGTCLEKGDKRSRSALRRIVRRLAAALASLFGLDGGQGGSQPPPTYHPLRALSNESRVGAIKTIDALSVRLNRSQSGRSTLTQRSSQTSKRSGGHSRSTLPPPSSPSPNAAIQQHPLAAAPSSQWDHTAADKLHKQGREKQSQSSRPHRDSRVTPASREKMPHTRQTQELPREPRGKKRHPPTTPALAPGPPRRTEHKNPRQPPHKSRAAHDSNSSSATMVSSLPDLDGYKYSRHPNRRISQITSSSASTKLGEIPESKQSHYPQAVAANPADQRQAAAAAQGQGLRAYNVRPVYPVRPFYVPPPVEEGRRKGFWRRFRKV